MDLQTFSVPLYQLTSGDILSLQVYRFHGATSHSEKPWKRIYLQANLHGAEISGNVVIARLVDYFQALEPRDFWGEITLVPFCNPLGANQRAHFFSSGRFNPYDGRDWNRIFWDYDHSHPNRDQHLQAFVEHHYHNSVATIQAAFRAHLHQAFTDAHQTLNQPRNAPLAEHYRYALQSLCSQADYVIDLHSSSNQALDYLYCCRGREDSAIAFGLDFGIVFDQYDGQAFDEAFLKPWLALEDCFAAQGRSLHFDLESWTLELGAGQQANSRSVERGIAGILNYLQYKQVLQPNAPTLNETAFTPGSPCPLVPKSHLHKYYAPAGGILQARLPLGTWVTPGQVLYEVLSFPKPTPPSFNPSNTSASNISTSSPNVYPQTIAIPAETIGLIFDQSTNEAVNQGDYVLTLAELPQPEP